MFGSIALDVVIGLVLVYLLYSLLATILAELVASWLGLRARMLRQAIERMLVDRYNEDAARFWWQRIIHPVAIFFLYEFKGFKTGLAGMFYREPAIKYLGRGKSGLWFFFNSVKPSYIRPETFSETLIRMMKNKGIGTTEAQKIAFCLKFNALAIQPNTLRQISNLFEDAGGDPDKFREKLNEWYNEMMGRLNGWFKRKIQTILFVLGLILAMTFNVDSISIARKLSRDKGARDQMVQMAISASDTGSALAKAVRQTNDTALNDSLLRESYRQVREASDDAGMILGLGWDKADLAQLSAPAKVWYVVKKTFTSWQRLLGFLITALAISLGSNFWFDLLGKLVSIRAAGAKPAEKTGTETEPDTPPGTLTVRTRSNGIPVPSVTPSTDPVSAMVVRLSTELMRVAGVTSVFRTVQKPGEPGSAGIRVNVSDEIAKKEVLKKVAAMTDLPEEVPVAIVVSGIPRTHQSARKGQISNKTGMNGLGSIGCVVRQNPGGKIHILSCWHVMKGDQNLDAEDTETTIVDHEKLPIATRWAGGIDGGYDFAFGRILPGKSADNGFLQSALGWAPRDIRPVSDDDIRLQTPVCYYDSLEGTVKKGKILSISQSMVIAYPDKPRQVSDILVITDDSTGEEKTISQPGNSGSVIFDKEGKAIGLIIAGDNSFTYACRLSPIFELFSEMKIV